MFFEDTPRHAVAHVDIHQLKAELVDDMPGHFDVSRSPMLNFTPAWLGIVSAPQSWPGIHGA